MVRAPCCEKMGLKKGPWTPEEDQLLVSYIERHGHGNWRALPKQAGLLRCGKSCRLRWINYLRPDIKRGNFTAEEEETIIKFHEMLGNRWSTIAAKLPGRTDNEIKNVWHTHLKKRLQKTNNYEAHHQAAKTRSGFKPGSFKRSVSNSSTVTNQSEAASFITSSSSVSATSSSDHCDQSNMNVTIKCEGIDSSLEAYVLPQIIDESFWSEETAMDDNSPNGLLQVRHQNPSDNSASESFQQQQGYGFNNGLNLDDGMDFWYDVFIRTGDFTELTF